MISTDLAPVITCRRTRVLSLTCALLAATVASWAWSMHRCWGLEVFRRQVIVLSSPATPEHTGLQTGHGVRLGQAPGFLYISFNSRIPESLDPDEIAWWREHRWDGVSWSAEYFTTENLVPDRDPPVYWLGWTAFSFYGAGVRNVGRQGIDMYCVSVPHWALTLSLGVCGMTLARRPLIETRRRKRGACQRCGYDLRGLITDAPCPECANAPRR